jgi:glycosyltransferase involved in cell wall biosynthesis
MLRQAIYSVLAQTYRDFEIIVVDDGSTDDTRETVASIVDPRIHYVWQENQERSVARNNGVREANGEFISFLDSDDAWLPHKLMLQVDLMDRYPEAVLVYGSDVRMDDQSQLLTPVDLLYQCNKPVVRDWHNDLTQGCTLSSIALLLRRQAFDNTGGFDPELSFAEDWDLWIRMSEQGPFCGVRIPVSAIRVHESRSLNDTAKMLSGRLAVIDKTWNRRGTGFDSLGKISAELDVFASYACRGIHLNALEANDWISSALARSALTHNNDAIGRAFVGYMVSIARSIGDCCASARWLSTSVHLINSLGGSESKCVWLGSFWGATIHAAHGIGDYPLAISALYHLLTCGGICFVDRGVVIAAVRSLFAFIRHPGAERKPLPRENEIATFLLGLRNMASNSTTVSPSKVSVEEYTTGGH